MFAVFHLGMDPRGHHSCEVRRVPRLSFVLTDNNPSQAVAVFSLVRNLSLLLRNKCLMLRNRPPIRFSGTQLLLAVPS